MEINLGSQKRAPKENMFFGVNFENLLLNIFENSFFLNLFTNVHLILGFCGRMSSLKIGESWAGPPNVTARNTGL